MRIQHDAVLVQIGVELLGSEHSCNADQLIVVVTTMEEGLLPENNASKHTAQTPHIQAIVIVLEVDQKFRSLEVATGHTHVIELILVVELSQAPIDESEFSQRMIDHHVVWFHITMHDAIRVAKVQRLQQFIGVVAHVKVCEGGVEDLKVDVVHILKDQTVRLGLGITDNIVQSNDVGATAEIHENFDFTFDLLLAHWLQNLDHTLFVGDGVHTLEYLTVFSTSHLAYNLVVILVSPVNLQNLVVPVLLGTMLVHVGIHSCTTSDLFHPPTCTCRVPSGHISPISNICLVWVCWLV
mmetsp:Transcript_39283/g.99006  ORF Transcript_39283/g.99006 Transcript_39283/m.99006 type:complete len:296 (+) Transcript_39283:247-1134(+)